MAGDVNPSDFSRIREKVENLTGERGAANRPLYAVRRSELQALASLKMRSDQVTAAPTMAQFNALQADVENIFKALQRISNLLGNASIPTI